MQFVLFLLNDDILVSISRKIGSKFLRGWKRRGRKKKKILISHCFTLFFNTLLNFQFLFFSITIDVFLLIFFNIYCSKKSLVTLIFVIYFFLVSGNAFCFIRFFLCFKKNWFELVIKVFGIVNSVLFTSKYFDDFFSIGQLRWDGSTKKIVLFDNWMSKTVQKNM